MHFAVLDLKPVYDGALIATVVIAGISVGLVTILFKTITAQKEYIETLVTGKKAVEVELQTEKDTSHKLHQENLEEIKRLNTRIDAIRDVPLTDIHKFMEQMGELIQKCYEILNTMNVKTVETHTIDTKLTTGGKAQ